jgi:hypothetical protein
MLWPEAIWQPVAQHGAALNPIAVTLHHQAGNGNPAGIYASRNVSAHFWLPKAGQPVQHVDSGVQSWHGVAHNAYSLGVETEGCASPPNAEPLTEHQLDSFGRLMAWANAVHGIPLVLSESVWTPGLNYHRCEGGPATGCPCDVRVNARAEILRRAAGGTRPEPQPEPEPVLIGDVWFPMTVFSNDLDARQTAVITWFAEYLHRQPDADSLAHWQGVIERDGMSSTLSNFLSQPEVVANLAGLV